MKSKKEATDKYTKEGYLYFSFGFLKKWKKDVEKLNEKKQGARFQFPNSMIKFCSKTKFIFGIGWRQVKGILMSLKEWIPIPKIPGKSQMSERFNSLEFDFNETLIKEEKQNIALDSTGIKLRFSGQWIREKHREKKPFLKLHVAVNTKTNQAISFEVTDDGISDISQARKLLDKSNKISKIKKGFMDGAYDEIKLWKWCEKKNIDPRIRLRKNARPHGLNLRSTQAKRMRKIGHENWMKERGMGEREPAECWNSSYKRRFGEHCCARKLENIIHEIKYKIMLCNGLITNFIFY